MSGSRFLVSMKDVMTSENILKVKNLVKEGFDISEVEEERDFPRDLQKLSEGVTELLLYKDFQTECLTT